MCKGSKAKCTKCKWLSKMSEELQRYAGSYNRSIYEKGRKKRHRTTVSFGGYSFRI